MRSETMPTDECLCPFCAETIKRAAIKCKHCGSLLDESDSRKFQSFSVDIRKREPALEQNKLPSVFSDTTVNDSRRNSSKPVNWYQRKGAAVGIIVAILFCDSASQSRIVRICRRKQDASVRILCRLLSSAFQ